MISVCPECGKVEKYLVGKGMVWDKPDKDLAGILKDIKFRTDRYCPEHGGKAA